MMTTREYMRKVDPANIWRREFRKSILVLKVKITFSIIKFNHTVTYVNIKFERIYVYRIIQRS